MITSRMALNLMDQVSKREIESGVENMWPGGRREETVHVGGRGEHWEVHQLPVAEACGGGLSHCWCQVGIPAFPLVLNSKSKKGFSGRWKPGWWMLLEGLPSARSAGRWWSGASTAPMMHLCTYFPNLNKEGKFCKNLYERQPLKKLLQRRITDLFVITSGRIKIFPAV